MIPVNVDRNVGPAAYRDATESGKLLVTSTFYTFQGEGPLAGRPAMFLRLAGCNLGAKKECPWCDTRFNIDEGTPVSLDQLVNLYGTIGRRCGLIVVTGGEPLLQWQTLAYMISEWNMRDTFPPLWQFETNGVFLDSGILDIARQFDNVTFVVSPKVIGGKYRPLPPEWRDYTENNKLSLKYVVAADPQSPYHELPAEVGSWAPWLPIFVSGQTEYGPDDLTALPGRPAPSLFEFSTSGRLTTAANYAYAARLALAHGYRVSFQTHLLAGVE